MEWSSKLSTLRRGIKLAIDYLKARLGGQKAAFIVPEPEGSRLVTISDFGDNPGHLGMLAYVPPSVAGRPLVVLLHGCGQDAVRFAEDTGWIDLADRLNIPLILPEQVAANNRGRCFQWFQPADTARDLGEAGSIAAMTRHAIEQFDSDPSRIFVVGLSAGGAMAAALLAAYPDLFAAGASVAGLPVGAARSGLQAIRRMASAGPDRSPEEWAAQVRAAAPAGFAGPWPRLSVWHGLADKTVAPGNGDLLATQWRALHDLTTPAVAEQSLNGVRHRMWPDGAHNLVEQWSLPDLPHAYPVGPREIDPGRFVAPARTDATAGIARFFGLTEADGR
jgi:poly(hydroxyalkanoate) depolymerase family esterase